MTGKPDPIQPTARLTKKNPPPADGQPADAEAAATVLPGVADPGPDAPADPADAPTVQSDAMTASGAEASAAAPADAVAASMRSTPAKAVRFARTRALLHRVPIPRPKTKRGVLLLAGSAVLIGAAAMFGGVQVVEYSESTAFCTLCHTMIPQEKAHAASTDAEVECGSCHVAPGVFGFVKAKLEGTHELYALVTNTYPRPIPPIEHFKLPSTAVTCQRCHPIDQIDKKNSGPSQLVLRSTFAQDETNTRKDLAVLLRPVNAGTKDALSVHWHVETPVTYSSTDKHLQSIDTVQFKDPKTGEQVTYIGLSKIRQSNDAGTEVERLKAAGEVRTMDCADCHNRVGHGVPSASKAIDEAMVAGEIDASLPYIKRNAMALVTRPYATAEAAQTAINALGVQYTQAYPSVAASKATQIAEASKALNSIYTLIATPAMNTGEGG